MRAIRTSWIGTCHDVRIRAAIRHITCDPDPQSLPDNPADFFLTVRLFVDPVDGPGEESFDLVVCSPEWLARCCRTEGMVSGLHHLIVNWTTSTNASCGKWLASTVAAIDVPPGPSTP